ncbi:MAG: FAD-dependent monooxygenase [Bauldia sp.]|nr:FAD-dependent monooxygenase [Bauldia sp.]MCW5717179.1 FAD-dependent monooxygenase [Bauldia sp.]
MAASPAATSRRPRPVTDVTAEIAIVGGGLAGLTAAVALARTGQSIVLLAPDRPADRRTTALLGESVAFIRSLGVFDAVATQSQPLRGIRVIDATGRLLRAPEVLFDAAELGLDAFGQNVPNEPLLAALEHEAARLGVVRLTATATAIEAGPDAIVIAGPEGTTVAARLCVGADGRKSSVRAAAGIGLREGRNTGQAAVVGTFEHALPHNDISTEFHTPNGPFTLVPLPGNRSALVWVTTTGEADYLRALPPAAIAEAVERQASSFLGAMTSIGPTQAFPLATATATRLVGERIALIGEAAHVLPPIAAQGFNLTLRDIAALARLVSGAPDAGAPDILAAYGREREADLGVRAIAVSLLNRSLLTAFLPAHAARNLGLAVLDAVPQLRRAVMRHGLGAT